MLSLLLNLLLVVQFNPSLASFGLSSSGGAVAANPSWSWAPPLARLEPLQRRVSFFDAASATNGTSSDEWSPILLSSSGAAPSAVASGTVWSTPSLIYPTASTGVVDPSTSAPLPFVVVASGRTLRFFSPLSRGNGSTSEGVRRGFTSQPLLVTAGSATTDFVTEVNVALCVCSMVVDSPAQPNTTSSSLTSKLYFTDAVGALNMVNLTQGRVSSGTSKAWVVGVEQALARPDRDRAGGSIVSTGTVTADPCPPCSGDVLAINSSLSAPTGLFYSPRAAASASVLYDANGDSLLDYFVVRGGSDSTILSMAAAADSTLSGQTLGLELLPYINQGPQTSGNELFSLVKGAATSGVSLGARQRVFARSTVEETEEPSSSPLFLDDHAVAPPQSDADTTQNSWIAERLHDGLRGTNGLRERLRSLVALPNGATRPNYFAVTAIVALPPVQVVRIPESITFGQFDSSGYADLVIGVTEYVNQSTLSVGRVGSGVAAANQTGVLIRRRMITLFGSTADGFYFRFDKTTTSGSVSSLLANSSSFLPGAQLRPAGTLVVSAYSPLLSGMISLEQAWQSQYTGSITVLSDNMLRSSNVGGSPTIVDLGFQPFGFSLQAQDSPFYQAATTLKRFQLSSLTVVRHDVGRDVGEISSLRSDLLGQWVFGAAVVTPDSSVTWNTAAATLSDLTTLAAGISSDPRSFLPSLLTGPHPAALQTPASTSASFGQWYDLAVVARSVESSVSLAAVQPLVECAWQSYYSTLAPAVLSHLNATDPADPTGRPTAAAQIYTMMQHDLQAAESFTSGWTEGVRLQAVGLQMEHGPVSSPSEWNKIVASPVMWTLVSLLVLVVAFLSYLVYRRRARLFGQVRQQHVLDEIRTVLELGAPPMPPLVSPSAASVAVLRDDACSSSACEIVTSSSSVPAPFPVAPPNTGLLSPVSDLVLPPSMPDGELVHPSPLIAPPTAVATGEASPSPSTASQVTSASSPSSSAIVEAEAEVTPPPLSPTSEVELSVSPESTSIAPPLSAGFVVVSPSPSMEHKED